MMGLRVESKVRRDKLFTHWRKNCPFIEYVGRKKKKGLVGIGWLKIIIG
jgi:hypothetical protein